MLRSPFALPKNKTDQRTLRDVFSNFKNQLKPKFFLPQVSATTVLPIYRSPYYYCLLAKSEAISVDSLLEKRRGKSITEIMNFPGNCRQTTDHSNPLTSRTPRRWPSAVKKKTTRPTILRRWNYEEGESIYFKPQGIVIFADAQLMMIALACASVSRNCVR